MRLRVHPITPPPFTDPLALLRAVAESKAGDYVMLHSSSGGMSVVGFDPLGTLNVDAGGIPRFHGGLLMRPLRSESPLDALQAAVSEFEFDAPHPLVGWLGFISYDLARHLENIPARAPDHLHWPLIRFSLFKHYVLFGRDGISAYSLAEDRPERFPIFGDHAPAPDTPPPSLPTQQPRAIFEEKIRRAKEYIAAGDIYQANLAQHWQIHTAAQPHDIFARLCRISPAPYAACMKFSAEEGDPMPVVRHVVSASPELFLHLADGRLVTRPIKGTRPRDLANTARDFGLREELLNSPKDHAELTMIVDLLRNDLGRVSEFGSVAVTEPRALEQHPTVWHTAATIESHLRAGVGLAELLAAVCPGGSITGAPKIRAMQIIEELEGAGDQGFRRALYCGNIGAIAPGARSLLLNIAIRTILFQGDTAHVYAGGGIVADSDPAQEYEETLHKAAALFRALNLAL